MNKIISIIQKDFISEALNSPVLFQDLANMEKYIAESYSGRSLIELLQNADDAGAHKFFVKLLDKNTYLVANDGREFTNEDMLSLCRSGASTKTRNSNTIGFRGIGFKSVVNYADVVHLSSGEIKCTFSRDLTKQAVSVINDVPLIRIPHDFNGEKYLVQIKNLEELGYKTIFIFQIRSNMLSIESSEFTSDSMIFLRSVNEILIDTGIPISFSRTTQVVDKNFIKVHLNTLKNESCWLVTKPETNEKSSVAFKMNEKHVVPAELQESVIHSFMPTNTKISIPFKINGDFSTDPSRTKVIIDEESIKASKACADIINGIVQEILKLQEDKYNIIDVLKYAKCDPLSSIRGEDINDLLIKNIQTEIQSYYSTNWSRMYFQPDGITDTDFTRIIEQLNYFGISRSLERNIPGLIEFLRTMGLKKLPIEDALKAMENSVYSEQTRISILSDVIVSSRTGVSSKMKKLTQRAKLFQFDSGVKSLDSVNETDRVDDNFENNLLATISSLTDYLSFAKNFGLNKNQLAVTRNSTNNHSVDGISVKKTQQSFVQKKAIRKWRSVEKNVAAVLEQLENIASVEDVSTMNLGYDLEAMTKDGEKRYYEVKSVDNMGDIISVTTNEYSTGAQYRDYYYLAVTCQTDTNIEICFIKDPINQLRFNKRVIRWVWTCDNYQGEVITTRLE